MNVLLVDDHSVVRAGLRRLMAEMPMAAIHEAANGRDALALLRSERPRLVVLDLNLPGVGGLELLRRMLQEDADLRILVLTMHAEAAYAGRAMKIGARGYVSKNASPEELLLAIRRVAEGGRYIENEIAQEMAMQAVSVEHPLRQLTGRDLEILRLLASGNSIGEIADVLGLGYKTVANAFSQMKAKLGVNRTADLIRLGIEMGLSQTNGQK
jgi:DNA-binding NarL/FixJ family response regulator